MLPLLSPSQWLTLHSAAVLLALATYAAVSLARRQRRSPSAAVAWVLFLAIAPYLGLPLFLVFGTRKALRGPRAPRMPVREAIRLTPGPGARIRALARSMGLPDAVGYRDLVIHRDGPHALARFKAVVEAAQHSIEISTFVLGRDAVGDEVGALLERRVREGVRVRLLLDGAGRFFGGVPHLQRLRKAGVEVALFGRLLSWPPGSGANLRNHRKMAIADGRWLWTGGRNLAAEYFVGGPRAGSAAWTDLTFDLQGAVVDEARHQFERDWALATGARDSDAPHEAAGRGGEAAAQPLGQFLPSGPDFADDTLYELLLDACFAASERILAATPYFVPDAALVMALTLAARRGVRVELVVPRRSNHRLADLARPSAIRDLLDAGAHVWFTPAMLHGKLLVIDDTAALAGSLNLDSRSLFLNYEMMVAFYEKQAIDGFVAWAAAARNGAERVQPRPVSAWRQIGEGLLRWLTFQL